MLSSVKVIIVHYLKQDGRFSLSEEDDAMTEGSIGCLDDKCRLTQLYVFWK